MGFNVLIHISSGTGRLHDGGICIHGRGALLRHVLGNGIVVLGLAVEQDGRKGQRLPDRR
jgi:hypothetical protein